MHRRLFNVMASQVRPGSIQPVRQLGLQQSLKQMRHRSAHSIRAREFVSHTQAECKAALSPRDPEPKISLGMQGRPCKLPGRGLSLPGEFSYRSTPRRQRHRNCCVCAVMMYVGAMRTPAGKDRKLKAPAALTGPSASYPSRWVTPASRSKFPRRGTASRCCAAARSRRFWHGFARPPA
jgi:hypothetical protein